MERAVRNRKRNSDIIKIDKYDRLFIVAGGISVQNIFYDIALRKWLTTTQGPSPPSVGSISASSTNPLYSPIILWRQLSFSYTETYMSPLSRTDHYLSMSHGKVYLEVVLS